jgi:hypothetical protein
VGHEIRIKFSVIVILVVERSLQGFRPTLEALVDQQFQQLSRSRPVNPGRTGPFAFQPVDK